MLLLDGKSSGKNGVEARVGVRDGVGVRGRGRVRVEGHEGGAKDLVLES